MFADAHFSRTIRELGEAHGKEVKALVATRAVRVEELNGKLNTERETVGRLFGQNTEFKRRLRLIVSEFEDGTSGTAVKAVRIAKGGPADGLKRDASGHFASAEARV